MNPKISVVIPMYNAEKFIETCIDSVLNQTFKNFEVIIIDDCSTDRSFEIVQKYLSDTRVRIYHRTRNHGESSTRNFGMDLAVGKFIFFMDHDDAIMENMLETFIIPAEESNADVVYMNSFFVASDPYFTYPGNIDAVKYQFPNPKARILSQNIIDRLQNEFIDYGVRVEPWNKLIRRDFLEQQQIYFPNMSNAGDMLQNFALLSLAKRILVIDGCCYIYRVHSQSTLRTPANLQLHNKIESFTTLLKYMEEIFSKMNLSRENQIMLQSFAIFFRIDRGFVNDSLSIEDVDDILQKVTCESINPNVTRILLHTLSILISNSSFKLKGEK